MEQIPEIVSEFGRPTRWESPALRSDRVAERRLPAQWPVRRIGRYLAQFVRDTGSLQDGGVLKVTFAGRISPTKILRIVSAVNNRFDYDVCGARVDGLESDEEPIVTLVVHERDR